MWWLALLVQLGAPGKQFMFVFSTTRDTKIFQKRPKNRLKWIDSELSDHFDYYLVIHFRRFVCSFFFIGKDSRIIKIGLVPCRDPELVGSLGFSKPELCCSRLKYDVSICRKPFWNSCRHAYRFLAVLKQICEFKIQENYNRIAFTNQSKCWEVFGMF